MEGSFLNEKIAREYDKNIGSVRGQPRQDTATVGIGAQLATGLDRPCKVPLMEQLLKQRAGLMEDLDRMQRLIQMLQEHPEFEIYENFRDLLRSRGW